MKKLILIVPDDKTALFNSLSEAIPGVKIVRVEEVDSIDEFRRQAPMVRLDYALQHIVAEKDVIKYKYDYAWLYAAIQGNLLKGVTKFRSVDDFRNHLRKLQIANVPSNSTISDKYSTRFCEKTFSNWTFTDCSIDEAERRIQVVKRFLSLYNKGK